MMQSAWNPGLFIQRRLGWAPALSLLLGMAGLLSLAWAEHAQPMAPRAVGKALEAPPVIKAPPPARWQAFVGKLPEAKDLGQDLHHVFRLAAAHGVRLTKGEYRLQRDTQAQVTTFAATFPITESYGQTHRFIADVVNELPHVALDELMMERTAADQGVIGSRVKFTFLYREHP